MNWYEINWPFKEDYYAQIGERWDQISQNVYDRPDLYYVIIEANKNLSEDNRRGLYISEKVNLKIPDIDISILESGNLPEWRTVADAT